MGDSKLADLTLATALADASEVYGTHAGGDVRIPWSLFKTLMKSYLDGYYPSINIQVAADVDEAELLDGVDGSLLYVESKEGWYQYCDDCTITIDHDLVLDTSASGTTRWLLNQKMSRTQGDTGWIDRDAAVITANGTTKVRLTLSGSATLALKGVRFQLDAGAYDCTLSGAAGLRYIGFDDMTGVLTSQTTMWNFQTQIPVSIARWSGTAIIGAPQTEMHGIRDNVWHYSHHFEFGLALASGGVFTGAVQTDNNTNPADDTCTFLWSTAPVVVDEDVYAYPGTGQWAQTLGSGLATTTAGIFPFLVYNGSITTAVAAMADRAPFVHGGGNTTPQWNNAGTMEASVTGDYIVYHYFASPMVGGWSVFARPHNAKYASLATALGARPSALVWENYAEIKHIYSAIWRVNTSQFSNATHRAKLVSLTDYRLTPGSPAAGISATDHQALSNRSATGAHPATSISEFPKEIGVACSDETTDLTAGTAKVTFRMPHALTLTGVRASLTTAATGATLLTVDINQGGASVLSTKLTIDATETTSVTAATPAVISTSELTDNSEITVDIDSVGSTTPGKGLKVYLLGVRW